MSNPLGELISRGEGDYNSYNRGTAKGNDGRTRIVPANQAIDFSQMTIAELQRRQSLPPGDVDRVFAVGKYQVIPRTMNLIVSELNISTSNKYTPDMQERMFADYLIKGKRPDIYKYIAGNPGATLRKAQKAACLEWASVEDPDRPGHVYEKYEKYGNRMHTTAVDIATAVNEMRNEYKASIEKGLMPEQAWTATISMGSGSFQTQRGDPTINALQQNLNALGITDARSHSLVVDGNLGGPNSHTSEAIATFKEQHGLTEPMSHAELLMATQVALKVKQSLDFDHPVREGLPGPTPMPHMINGMPDYLVSGRNAPSQAPASLVVQATPPPPAMPTSHSPLRSGSTLTPQHRYTPPPLVEPAIPSPLPATQILEPGDRGAAVQALQQHLQLLGASDRYGQKIKDDRDYGDRTREAVEQFQLWTGREPTGIADPDTLQALQSQAQFALRQRGQGIVIAPEAHLAEHLAPTTPNRADAAIERPVQGRGQAGLTPFSDPQHPQHALYADVQQRFQAKGHELSEAHLSALTRQMHFAHYRPGWPGDVTVYEGQAVASGDYQTSRMMSVELNAPTPSVQETMQAFQTQQQTLAEHMETMNRQQTQSHSHGLSR